MKGLPNTWGIPRRQSWVRLSKPGMLPPIPLPLTAKKIHQKCMRIKDRLL